MVIVGQASLPIKALPLNMLQQYNAEMEEGDRTPRDGVAAQ